MDTRQDWIRIHGTSHVATRGQLRRNLCSCDKTTQDRYSFLCTACIPVILVTCVLIAFISCDLIEITEFQARYGSLRQTNFKSFVEAANGANDVVAGNVTVTEMEKQARLYERKEAMAITLMILLMCILIAAKFLHVANQIKQHLFFLPFLIITFPILIMDVVYTLIYRDASIFSYLKIALSLNILFVVLCIYYYIIRRYIAVRSERTIAYETRTALEASLAAAVVGQNDQPTGVLIKLTPPPYERDPPAYKEAQTPVEEHDKCPPYSVDNATENRLTGQGALLI